VKHGNYNYHWIDEIVKHPSFSSGKAAKLKAALDTIAELAEVADDAALFTLNSRLWHVFDAIDRLSVIVARYKEDFIGSPTDEELKKELGI